MSKTQFSKSCGNICPTNLITPLNHLHPGEQVKEANKGKVDKAKAIKTAKLARSQQPRYEQRIKALTRKLMETSEKDISVDVLLSGRSFKCTGK